MQLSPHYPESHNLHGLVCEARNDYKSASTFYRLARHAINIGSRSIHNSHIREISINLARSLSKVNYTRDVSLVFSKPLNDIPNSFYLIQAGNAADALQECEHLKKEGSDPDFAIHLFEIFNLIVLYFKILSCPVGIEY